MPWLGKARPGQAWRGLVRHGEARQGEDGLRKQPDGSTTMRAADHLFRAGGLHCLDRESVNHGE